MIRMRVTRIEFPGGFGQPRHNAELLTIMCRWAVAFYKDCMDFAEAVKESAGVNRAFQLKSSVVA